MKAILECCCGLDVHRDTVVACILKGALNCEPEAQIRTFSTILNGLTELRQWLEANECRNVAMESTGVYWQPVYQVLEEAFDNSIVILVVNAKHMKNVPGRKTDTKDAQWIATLLRAGLLQGSFIPSKPTRELRDLTRYRKSLVEEATAHKNRIEKFLQAHGFKLSTIITDVFGTTGRAILEHLKEHGQITTEEVGELTKGRLKKKNEEIGLALRGVMSKHERNFLALQLKHLSQVEANIKEIENEIEQALANFKEQLELLDGIPGIDIKAASAIIAEIGSEMGKFPTVAHLCSWAGLSPGANESAGKKSPQK